MKVVLYRGVCNLYETINIITNHTIGGLIDFSESVGGIKLIDGANSARGKTKYSDLDHCSADKYIISQGGTGGERLPRIVDIADPRPLIEYTYSVDVATRFGMLGVITAEIDDQFLSLRGGGVEDGVFCVSNANVHSLTFCLSTSHRLTGENARLKECFIDRLSSMGIELKNGFYHWSE